MGSSILLLVLSMASLGAMSFILRWFFRRLSRIEHDYWEDKADAVLPGWARFLGQQKREETASVKAPTAATERAES